MNKAWKKYQKYGNKNLVASEKKEELLTIRM